MLLTCGVTDGWQECQAARFDTPLTYVIATHVTLIVVTWKS